MKCTSCGAELAPNDKFCGECGAPRPEVPAPAGVERTPAQPPSARVVAAPEPEAPVSRKRSRRKWVAIGCIGLLAVACVVAGATGVWLLSLLSESQELTVALPGIAGAEPTAAARATPTWLPQPPTPTRQPAPPTSAPPPAVAPVVVMPYCSGLEGPTVVYVQENQPVTVYWGWVATTPEYVQDFLDTATIQVFLDDELVKPDTQSEVVYDSEDEGYLVSWSADVGTLTPGAHRLDYHVSWSRQISDGWYTYGPGGETEEEHEYCELIVE